MLNTMYECSTLSTLTEKICFVKYTPRPVDSHRLGGHHNKNARDMPSPSKIQITVIHVLILILLPSILIPSSELLAQAFVLPSHHLNHVTSSSSFSGVFDYKLKAKWRARVAVVRCNSTTRTEHPIPISTLYESENVIAIDKPPNIPHHDSDTEKGIISLVRELQELDDDNESQFKYKGRIYGVHRLDRVTSGILLLAKNQETARSLSESFRSKENVTKYYIALTSKKPKKKKQGWVKGDMVPSRRGSWKLVNKSSSQTNPAVSRFFTAGLGKCDFDGCNHFDVSSKDEQEEGLPVLEPKTMILFQPLTGKTHQLRVAAKSLGLSILGDERYGDSIEAQRSKRTYLHALAIHVKVNEEDVAIWNPPEEWSNPSIGVLDENSIASIMEKLFRKHCTNDSILEKLSTNKAKSI